MTTETDRAAAIAALNDACRKSGGAIGRHFTTDGVAANGPVFIAKAIAAVAAFADFNADNDPYGEHDFGKFVVDGETLFWKIDCYDKADPDLGADDPANPATTERVLTIMLAEEY